ncbi:NfeD family protein [Clostridium cylindrosporum]|uniref:Membrane-bound serine protease n=1 Tax=Clostridium cylindrosporum DSM 605 TaxID=1121307 RepID=A0A0J8D6D4_CLOCY|nr:NfeD family protein [Clostridium cylindrosporum]KMT21650.1 membrane-bound serine protease [Clostridium cylindrosporum DSM 605]
MKKRSILFSLILITIIFTMFGIKESFAAASDKGVYVIPIKGDIGPSVETFVSNQLKKAEDLNIDIIVLDINTLGGKINSTLNLQETVKKYNSKFKFYSFINNKAESAGVMIALLGDKIFMTKDATIGSASVVPFDEKSNSAWSAMLKAQAESKGKPGSIAKATADYNIEIPGIKGKGTLLNMTSNDAIKLKFADGIASNITEVAKKVEYRGDKIIVAEKDFKVTLSEIISNQYVSILLLLLGIIALIAEMFIPSFGILGTLGATSIGVYFLGNIFAGNSTWWSLGIFVLGIILILIELGIPGFGAAGIGGLMLISISIVMSAETMKIGLFVMICSWLVAGIGIYVIIKYGFKRGLFSKVILKSNQEAKDFISYDIKKAEKLLGKEGVASSMLRPSGIAIIDGNTIDVQTNGDFIKEGTQIKVDKIEGNKIIVKKFNK